MFQVFEPFEVADCDSTGIAEDIWKEFDSFGSADALSFDGGWPISSLYDDTAFKAVSIILVD